MGAFNTVRGQATCPICGEMGEFDIQFKYGDTWQHTYCVGEKIKWGGNAIGKPGHKKVLVEAISGRCPHCGRDDIEFDVVLISDVITELKGIGKDRTNPSVKGYIVAE